MWFVAAVIVITQISMGVHLASILVMPPRDGSARAPSHEGRSMIYRGPVRGNKKNEQKTRSSQLPVENIIHI
jgi:hypothetical protein